MKGTCQNQPNEETHMTRSGRILNTELPRPLLVESECITLLAHQCIHQPGSSTGIWYLEFSLGFDYIGMTDRIICLVIKLNIQPLSPFWGLHWLKAPTF